MNIVCVKCSSAFTETRNANGSRFLNPSLIPSKDIYILLNKSDLNFGLGQQATALQVNKNIWNE